MASDKKKIIKYLLRLKQGEGCFDEFVECAIGYVGYVAYKNLACKSFIGDVISETFKNVVRYIHTLDSNGNPLAWLCKIAQNEAYKINNREQSRNEVGLEDIVESDFSTPDKSDKYLEVIDLYKALDSLDEIDRKIIEYIYFDDRKYKDIAAELCITIGDVHYRKKKALKELLKILSD
ncbi:MAG: sigma-70 family RNA polymerase sigma factor [Clostridiales bacterium]|nr:sigma-70 family RNA polymerase sigma factor [Clostridiales bacterium]